MEESGFLKRVRSKDRFVFWRSGRRKEPKEGIIRSEGNDFERRSLIDAEIFAPEAPVEFEYNLTLRNDDSKSYSDS